MCRYCNEVVFFSLGGGVFRIRRCDRNPSKRQHEPNYRGTSKTNTMTARTIAMLLRWAEAASLASAPQQARLYVTLFQRAATSKTEPGPGSP